MKQEYFIKQLEEAINEYENIEYEGTDVFLKSEIAVFKAKAAVARIAGLNSEYYKDINEALTSDRISAYERPTKVLAATKALKSDLERGYLKSFGDIIKSEIFSDYLEMADHILAEGYKDPAAVLVGSTLENHLRELCKSNSIKVEIIKPDSKVIAKSAEVMNHDLTKASVYSSAYQKQVTAWLGLRNSAAHGKYDEYTEPQIKLMLDGIRQFILFTT